MKKLETEPAGTYTGRFDSPFRFKNADQAIWAKTQSGNYPSYIPTYPRSGSGLLFNHEGVARRLFNAQEGYFYYVNSGMSAAVCLVETTAPTKGDVIVYSPKVYGRTASYFNDILAERGVQTVKLDSVHPLAIEEQLRAVAAEYPESAVKALWIELVGNGMGTPVADIVGIRDLRIWRELPQFRNTRLFFDNTLPTNVVIPVPCYFQECPDIKAAQGDSTTKFLERNLGLGGFIYTVNEEIGKKLWTYRTVLGYTPDADAARASLNRINKDDEDINEIKERFDRYILVAMANTARLAEGIVEVAGDRLLVSHPGLPSHPDHELAKKWHPRGWISPVLFIAPVSGDPLTAEQMYRSLEEYGAFRKIQQTDSFGFEAAGIYYNNSDPSLRFAGGQETLEIVEEQIEQLQKAIIKTLK